jgi:hypothetical protein
MAQSGYMHANHLASEIRNELRENNSQMLSLMQSFNGTNVEYEPEEIVEHQSLTANSATQASVQAETLKVLVEMQQQLQNLSKDVRTGNGKGRNLPKKTPDNPPYSRTVTDKYCWTHGGCNHNSNQCTRRALGHKNEATRDNKLDGSKAFCK